MAEKSSPTLRLHLLRHADAASGPDLADFKRPLSGQGEQEAALMAAWFRKIALAPHLVLCSPALRTRQTWERVQDALPDPHHVGYPDEIYEADGAALARLLREAADGFSEVLMIGHNPGMQILALTLVGAGAADEAADEAGRAALSGTYPPAALATLRLKAERWAEIGTTGGTLERFTAPEDLI